MRLPLRSQVLAAVAFRALYQSCVLPESLESEKVGQYLEEHPASFQKEDEAGKAVGPLALASLVFEVRDGNGRDVLRKELNEVESLLTELEDSGKQGLPIHSYLCKRPETILRLCVPSEGVTAALHGFDRLGGVREGLTTRFAKAVKREHDRTIFVGVQSAGVQTGEQSAYAHLYHVKPSGEVRSPDRAQRLLPSARGAGRIAHAAALARCACCRCAARSRPTARP